MVSSRPFLSNKLDDFLGGGGVNGRGRVGDKDFAAFFFADAIALATCLEEAFADDVLTGGGVLGIADASWNALVLALRLPTLAVS